MIVRPAIVMALLGSSAAFAQDVALMGASSDPTFLQAVADAVQCTGEFVHVDTIDLTLSTPTASELSNYHSVMVFGDVAPADPINLGNALAAHHEAGNGLVVALGPIVNGTEVGGAVVDYLPVTIGIRSSTPAFLPAAQTPGTAWGITFDGHPSNYGVNQLFATDVATYGLGITVKEHAETTVRWDDGTPLMVVAEAQIPNAGRIVAINMDPVVDVGWFAGTDGDRVISQALLWTLRNEKPVGTCYNEFATQDLDCDSFDVEDSIPVDLSDPECAWAIDRTTGQPFPSDDYFYDYESFGCTQPLFDRDLDSDGLTGLVSHPVGLTPIISELIEGEPRYNDNGEPVDGQKAFEFKNITGADYLASECVVNIYQDGSFVPSATIQLMGRIDPDSGEEIPVPHLGTHTVCHPDVELDLLPPDASAADVAAVLDARCVQLDPNLQFDGNDAIELNCKGVPADIFGRIGFNPGTTWSVILPTKDIGLRRYCNTTVGDTDGSDPYDPASTGWYGRLPNDFGNLNQDHCGATFGQIQILSPDGLVAQTLTSSCDNCGGDFNPDQADIDCDGIGDLCDNCSYTPNADQTNAVGSCPGAMAPDDCHGDACDNCPCTANNDQSDLDYDDVGDACDNCILAFNPDQGESDICPDNQPDGFGNACDNCPEDCNPQQTDSDNDGVGDICDNCALVPNGNQIDSDGDGLGDACDVCPMLFGAAIDDQTDSDGDGVGDKCENCLDVDNRDQADTDFDGYGDACDNCPSYSNSAQGDQDGDGVGDVCDICPEDADPDQGDRDGDGVGDVCDGCPELADADAKDSDGDGISDSCDLCTFVPSETNVDSDADGIGNACDNCPNTANPMQEDEDNDGEGDACDPFKIRGGGSFSTPNGGCSSAPGPASWVLLSLMALGFRRRR